MRPRRHDYQLEAASICGTDLHLFEEDPAYPVILGHELCGRVVEMGPDAAKSMRCYTGEVKLSDRICLYPWVVCGTCENCLTYGIGACGVCDNSFVYGVPYESLGFGARRSARTPSMKRLISRVASASICTFPRHLHVAGA